MRAREAREGELDAWLAGFLREAAFVDRYPYHAATLARMLPVADPSVQRMAVSLHDGRFYLHVNVESFLEEPQFLRGVLLHEVHHVVLGHLTHPKFSDVTEPELMELALEMSANEYVEEPLPSPITWKAYASAGLRAGQSTMERYEKLVAAAREKGARPRPSPAEGGLEARRVDDHRFLRKGGRIPGGLAQTRLLVESALREARSSRPDDDPFLARFAGQSPGRILQELGAQAGPAAHHVDWKKALSAFVARARAPVHTYARPNRRFPGAVGSVPGRTYVPRAVEKPRLLVALDTSLSMSLTELEEVGRQLVLVAEHARITVAECDVEVSRVYPFEGRLEAVVGRGGTDLRPAFDPELLGRIKPDGIVYFTDGEGPFPTRPPPVPTLWVLTKPEAFLCPFGDRAWLGRGPSPTKPGKRGGR